MPYDQGMTSPPHGILGNIRRVLDSDAIKAPRPSRLHVGTAVLDWFRSQTMTARPTLGSTVDGLLRIPVISDPGLEDGQWQCFDQYGKVLREGRIGEPGESIFYVAGQGFYAWKGETS